MAANPNLVIGRQTDKGRVRPGNEDSIGTPGMFQIPRERLAQRGTLVAVADGMGGHAAGEVASQMAITALFKSYYAALDANPEAALRSAYSIANTEIYNLACPASPVHYQADPVATLQICSTGVMHLLELAKRDGARIFHASTSEIYGDPVEIPQNDFYIGVQFHPEFKSRPNKAHPLFLGLIEAALTKKETNHA